MNRVQKNEAHRQPLAHQMIPLAFGRAPLCPGCREYLAASEVEAGLCCVCQKHADERQAEALRQVTAGSW